MHLRGWESFFCGHHFITSDVLLDGWLGFDAMDENLQLIPWTKCVYVYFLKPGEADTGMHWLCSHHPAMHSLKWPILKVQRQEVERKALPAFPLAH